MLRTFAAVAVAALIATGFGISPSHAQKPQAKQGAGCSLEGCIAACNKNAGRQCNLYCQNEMGRRGCGAVH